MLQFVIDHGNVTHYEYRTGKRPTAVEPFRIRIEEDSNIVNTDEGVKLWLFFYQKRIPFKIENIYAISIFAGFFSYWIKTILHIIIFEHKEFTTRY